MLRQLTAGESHGKALVAILEGLPAGVSIGPKELAGELARRRHGYGRSGRQRFEADTFEILSGVRHGRTLGSPIGVTIANAEWEDKYRDLMGVEGQIDPADKLTRPRPGHADLAGVLKYGFDDVRNVLERASARETAARVALGCFCKAFLAELGIHVISHVVRIGKVASRSSRVPTPQDLDVVDASPVRAFDETAGARMVAEIDAVRKARDTLGGVFEVLAYGCPPGLGSHVQADRKLDARLALALMSIQSVKGVEVGDGFATAARPGSRAHDGIVTRGGSLARTSARAGGDEAVLDCAEAARDGGSRDPEGRDRDQAADGRLRGAGRRGRRRGRGGVRARGCRAREVRRRLAARDAAQPAGLRGGTAVIVYLVGMPGSGKSTVGPELARLLGVPFVELDAQVEAETGLPVREIFAREGEARFRELEAAALQSAGTQDPSVVSCGGGVVLEPANRVTLRATGEIVFLSVPLEVLHERVEPAPDRPLIRQRADLERLFREREPLYREFAAHVVDGTGTPDEVAERIRQELLRWSG